VLDVSALVSCLDVGKGVRAATVAEQ
jgi:hypothetical protein